MSDVIVVEGIGEVYGQKLKAAGIKTTGVLLAKGATRSGRQEIEKVTGLSVALILKWVNHVDLYRIKGVAKQYAELLEAAGVDSVPELSHRVPGNLTPKLAEVNALKKLVRKVPTESQVASWVEQAKHLPRVVSH